MTGLSEAKAALERGRSVVLVTPPAVEQAGELWALVAPPAVIVCTDAAGATEWAAAAPAGWRLHPVTGLARAARLLKEEPPEVLAGSVLDLTALITRPALKLEAVQTLVLAWPEAAVTGQHGAALDNLLAEARDARRIVLSWNPAQLGDFLERHARRAHLVGTPPVAADGRPLPPPPSAPARFAVVASDRRAAGLREALDALDPRRPFVWSGGPVEPPAAAPDAVVCARLPTREQFAALARLGEPVLLVTAAQLPYARSIAAPLSPLRLPGTADRAKDRTEALRERIARLLEGGGAGGAGGAGGDVDAELAVLAPLFERFDPAEVAAALLALQRAPGAVSRAPDVTEPVGAAWVNIFINVGKKDRAGAKDLVGALIKEVKIPKAEIGRIDLRETFTLVEIAPRSAEQAVRGLTGVTIRGRRVTARLDRGA